MWLIWLQYVSRFVQTNLHSENNIWSEIAIDPGKHVATKLQKQPVARQRKDTIENITCLSQLGDLFKIAV